MAVPFSTDAEQVIHRCIDTKTDDLYDESHQLFDFFEVERCCQWIQDQRFRRVT